MLDLSVLIAILTKVGASLVLAGVVAPAAKGILSVWEIRNKKSINHLIEGNLMVESLTSDEAERILLSLPEIRATTESNTKFVSKDGLAISAASSRTPSEVARERVIVRLAEARGLRKAALRNHQWSKWSSNLLTTAQVVVGGVLASSFIQEELSPKWVGGLGVLVLLSSLFKQQFHPEIEAETAQRKAAQLQNLIRSCEDNLAITDVKLATGQDHSDALIALMVQITQGISTVEDVDFTSHHSKARNTKDNA